MVDVDVELLEAVKAGDLTRVSEALENGADVDARERGWERTALMLASSPTRPHIMKALLDAGAAVDLTGSLGETALILAASGRGGESITLLLTHGADPNMADRDQKTPLMWAVDPQFHHQSNTHESAALLITGGARVNDHDENGKTALMWAVDGLTSFDVRPATLATLVELGADVNATDPRGETAMFRLVRYIDSNLDLTSGPDCIKVLIDAGADPNAVNSAGKTPLGTVDPNNPLVLDLLRDLGFR